MQVRELPKRRAFVLRMMWAVLAQRLGVGVEYNRERKEPFFYFLATPLPATPPHEGLKPLEV